MAFVSFLGACRNAGFDASQEYDIIISIPRELPEYDDLNSDLTQYSVGANYRLVGNETTAGYEYYINKCTLTKLNKILAAHSAPEWVYKKGKKIVTSLSKEIKVTINNVGYDDTIPGIMEYNSIDLDKLYTTKLSTKVFSFLPEKIRKVFERGDFNRPERGPTTSHLYNLSIRTLAELYPALCSADAKWIVYNDSFTNDNGYITIYGYNDRLTLTLIPSVMPDNSQPSTDILLNAAQAREKALHVFESKSQEAVCSLKKNILANIEEAISSGKFTTSVLLDLEVDYSEVTRWLDSKGYSCRYTNIILPALEIRW